MKKSLVALAALAAAGVASAQSSVTLFGVVDAAYQNLRAEGTTAAGVDFTSKQNRLTDSGYNSSRIGLRGVEDLGGGLSASFWLEAGVNNDNGTGDATNVNNQRSAGSSPAGTQGLTFNRRSTLSLSGGFGEVRVGRDYTPSFYNLTTFDPFGTNGGGQVTNIALHLGNATGVTTTVRASNSLAYFLPSNLGGFYGSVMYAMGENTDPITGNAANGFAVDDDGEHIGARLGFAAGPLNVGIAYGQTEATGTANVARVTLATPIGGTVPAATPFFDSEKYKNASVGVSYDLGVARLMAQYLEERFIDLKHKVVMVGGLVPVGAGEIRVSYTRGKADDAVEGDQFALGYVHNLSKRTALYSTFALLKNKGDLEAANYSQGLAVTRRDGDSRSIEFGVRHSF